MDLDEAIKRTENIITCEKCQVAGKECKSDCPVQYEAGTMGECIEAVETVLNFAKKNQGSEQERWLRGE